MAAANHDRYCSPGLGPWQAPAAVSLNVLYYHLKTPVVCYCIETHYLAAPSSEVNLRSFPEWRNGRIENNLSALYQYPTPEV